MVTACLGRLLCHRLEQRQLFPIPLVIGLGRFRSRVVVVMLAPFGIGFHSDFFNLGLGLVDRVGVVHHSPKSPVHLRKLQVRLSAF